MKTRIIRTGIYTDETMLSMTPDVRFICVYLYTNDHIRLNNIYKIPVQLVQLETGYDISTIKIALDKLSIAKVVQHFNYLWVKLLRNDFASLDYKGEKNEVAIENYLKEIPEEVLKELSDTSIDTSIHSSYKSEIINNKLKTINKKQEIKEKLVFGELNNVLLTEEEYTKLQEKLPKIELDKLIESLSLYISSKGTKYKSHYATILSWSKRNEVETKKSKVSVYPEM